MRPSPILTAAAAAGLLAGAVPAGAVVVDRGPLLVRGGPWRQADVLGDRAVTVTVRNRSGGRLRLTGAAGVPSRAPAGPVSTARLGPRGLIALRLALDGPAVAEASGCGSPELALRLRAAGGRRRVVVHATVPVAPGAPACRRFFGPHAVWNEVLPADAPLAPDSDALAQGVAGEIAREYRDGPPPTINTTRYSAPVYTVPSDQPGVPVTLDNPTLSPDLTRLLAAVPIPPAARVAAGTDAQMVIWQPGRDAMWEFWGMRHAADGWRARWGGALEAVTSGPGHFAPPHATWGATATGLPLAGGLITPHELARGVIPHALALVLPTARANVYVPPAQRTDGTTRDAGALPEGARLRVDPRLDLTALPEPVRAIAVAAQRYGLILRDRGDDAALYAQDPISLGADPYPRLFGGRSGADVLRDFPWDHLQVMRMELRDQPPREAWPPVCGLVGCS